MNTYYFTTNSNAAPFFSDTNNGFIEAPTAMDALKKIVKNYDHPCGLYAAIIQSCEENQKLLARYTCKKAVATGEAQKLTEGGILKEGDKIRVLKDGKHKWIPINFLAKEGKWEDLE